MSSQVEKDVRNRQKSSERSFVFSKSLMPIGGTKLERFRGELEGKFNQVSPRNFGSHEPNCDPGIHPDFSFQESPIASSGDPSKAVASVHGMFHTDMMQVVGQLRSFIECEVRSLRNQFAMQSEKVEQSVIVASRSEAINKRLSQRMAEIGQDVALLCERDITSKSAVSELRSRLEVVVRECDEHTKEQGCRIDETAAFLSSMVRQENGLSERVQSLENACQQAVAMPAIMHEAAESLRAELRRVVDPLRDDVNYLKAIASSQQNDQEFGEVAESKDAERRTSPHEVTSLHKRLTDFEVSCAAESRLVWQFLELLQKECIGVQDVMNKLADSAQTACASSIMKAKASLSNGLVSIENSSLATGLGAVITPLEGAPKEVPQESRVEMAITRLHEFSEEMSAQQAMQITMAEKRFATSIVAINTDVKSVREMVAGTIMTRISALESMMTRHLGSGKTYVAQTQVQSQVPMAVEANSTLSSESHPVLVHATSPLDMKVARTSVPLDTNSGISLSPKDVGRILIGDGGSGKDHKERHGCGSKNEPVKATHASQSPFSAEIPSRRLSFGLRPSAFNGLAALHSAKETPPSCESTALSTAASSSVMSSPRRKSAWLS